MNVVSNTKKKKKTVIENKGTHKLQTEKPNYAIQYEEANTTKQACEWAPGALSKALFFLLNLRNQAIFSFHIQIHYTITSLIFLHIPLKKNSFLFYNLAIYPPLSTLEAGGTVVPEEETYNKMEKIKKWPKK
jgi:hypothetical protein